MQNKSGEFFSSTQNWYKYVPLQRLYTSSQPLLARLSCPIPPSAETVFAQVSQNCSNLLGSPETGTQNSVLTARSLHTVKYQRNGQSLCFISGFPRTRRTSDAHQNGTTKSQLSRKEPTMARAVAASNNNQP